MVLLAGARDAALRLIGEDQAEDGRALLTALSRRWVAQYTQAMSTGQRGDGRIVAAGILAARILHVRLETDTSDEGGSPLGTTGALAALQLPSSDAVRRRAARDLLMFDDDRLTGVTRILMKSGREQIAACGHLTREVLAAGDDGFAQG